MREPCSTVIISLPATEAAQLLVVAYEVCQAHWAEPVNDEELACLQGLMKRKAKREGDDNAQS